jgi:ribonuclease J
MRVSVTVYGGAGQIGGNKILVTDKDTRVMLDFGAGFSDGVAYYGSGIQPRLVNGAGDYFEFDMLPNLTGFYSEKALQNTPIKHTSPEIDAIVLSHYHSDHMGRIDLTDPEIPVYCGETTQLIHSAYSEAGGSSLDDHKIVTFRTGHKFRIGAIEFEPVHVDHSIPGAYGFVIHTTEGPLVYTGDFRFHGPMGTMTHDLIERAAQARPKMLLTEGTRVRKEESKAEIGEPEVAERTSRLLARSDRLAFSSFRGNDVDRIVSFHEACKANGRRLVVSMKVAMLLEKLAADKRLKVPRVGRDVSVYVKRKRKGAYDDREYLKWERTFLDGGLNASDIRSREKDYLLHLDQWYLPELIDIKPQKGGVYIHATTEAFNEEGEQDEQVIHNWVDHFGFSYHQIHASGHAPMAGVLDLVNKIRSDEVVPIHTEEPSMFAPLTRSHVTIPQKGVPVYLS